MRPPCESMVTKLLPALRALISYHLIQDYGFTQEQAAQALGMTQASISRSLTQLDRFEPYYTPNVRQAAANFAEQLSERLLGLEEGIAALCTFCSNQKIGGALCQIHRDDNPELHDCMVCAREFTSDERIDVLKSLTRSVNLMVATPEFNLLIPQVGAQIVMSTPMPKDINDIAGFPSRIIIHNNRACSFTQPEFRGSYHLSKILLFVQQHRNEILAAIVFKYLEGVENTLQEMGLKFIEIIRQRVNGVRNSDEALLAGINQVVRKDMFFDVLIDKGLIGIEPVAYLFAPDAENATKRTIELAKKLQKRERSTN